MGKVRTGLAVSLDGFISGPNDGPDAPMGDGGERLLAWYAGHKRDLPWRKSQIFDAIAKRPGISIAGLIATVYGGNATAATIKTHVAQANDLFASSSDRTRQRARALGIVTTPGASW